MATRREMQTQWRPEELRRRLEKGEEPFIFDVRNEEEYESWKIEGRRPLPAANVPYYEMLEEDDFEDVVDSFRHFLVKRSWAERLPEDRPILAVCAQGDTSEYVAEALRQLDFEAFNLAGGTQAWGDHYHARAVAESAELSLYQVGRPARGCLSYLVASRGRAVVIDPLRHIDRYLELAESKKLRVELVLDTHAHADHISGGPALAERLGVPYHLHPYDGVHPLDVLPATLAYEYLRDGSRFRVGGATLGTLHVPGHTLGNVAFLLDERYLFSGDSIFVESIARPDLGGRAEAWAPIHYRSLNRLLELPDDTLVLPAHFSSLAEGNAEGLVAAPLGHLKATNEGLVMARRSEREFVDYILASLPEFPDEYVEIKRVNAGLAAAGEARASELELGKNVCALSQAYDRASS